MTDREILQHIDSGANYYVSMFGNAEHMEIVDKGCYCYVQPKANEHGIRIIYNVRVDDLPIEQQDAIVTEIKALRMPIWLDLLASDEVFRFVFGKDKVHGQTVMADDDEVYMAVMPEEIQSQKCKNRVLKVQAAEEFAIWAKIVNDVLAQGYPDMHPVYHYPLCKKGLMKCYIAYHDSEPASAAAIMDNNGVASLEFVATMPEMRRQGYAKSVCEKAVSEAFADGAKIVTVRAADSAAAHLYQSIGFRAYNYAI